jgi:hypothetical protein
MSNDKRLFAVIHCRNPFSQNGLSGVGHALANAKMAANKIESGADGILLLGEGLPNNAMIHLYQEVRKQHHDLYIGVSFLDIEPSDVREMQKAVSKCQGLNALYTRSVSETRIPLKNDIECFSGVATHYGESNPGGALITKQMMTAQKVGSHVFTTGATKTSAQKHSK